MKTRRVSRVGCRVSAVALLAAAVLSGTARGTEYFVAPTGLDTGANHGTNWSQPLLTISNAVAKAVNPGDIVTVSNGTYSIATQITVTAAITVRSFGNGVYGGLDNASNTIVQRSSGTGRIFNNTLGAIDGFTIRNGNGGNGYLGKGVYIGSGRLQNCVITNNNSYGSSGGDGGGVYMIGGTVSNCVIRNNTAEGAGGGAGNGSGVYATGGLIINCSIIDNRTSGGLCYGVGVYLNGAAAALRNCLIARNVNYTTGCGGGGVYMNNGIIESCTIVSNTLTGGAAVGGGVYRVAGTVANSVIIFNKNATLDQTDNYSGLTSANTFYSCTTPALGGTGNTAAYQGLVNPAGGDYRLLAGPAVDAGINQPWMAGALDLAGNPRTNGVNNRVDMGAYEYVPGALQCGLSADATAVLPPSKVVFTAYVAGTNTSITSYNWDFGDGNTASGPALAIVTNTYVNPGLYTVKLTVTNTANEVAASTNANYVTVWGANVYVWTSSPSPTAPYTNWTTAARLVGTAVGAAPAGVTVWVTNGTYSEAGTITLSKSMTVRSFQSGLSGASNTIVRASGGNYSVFNVGSPYAEIEGLTIRDAWGWPARGVVMSAGLVRNCIIRNNGNTDNADGIGVSMTGGTVSNCLISGNTGGGGGGSAGSPVYISGGSMLVNSLITDNTANNGNGGGVQMDGASALVRNCVVARNRASSWNGGGVYLTAGTIESCTIVTNIAGGSGGGIYRTGGIVRNCIVYNNTAGDTYKNIYNADANVTYTCTTNPVAAGTGCITDDPRFENPGAGDYHLRVKPALSPCIDTGTNQAWMAGAKDLAGADRKLFGSRFGSSSAPIVDMGAYEMYVSPKGSVLVLR